MTRFTHPEQRPNEIFGGNIWPGDFPRIGWRTKRLGKKGFDRDGKPFGRSDSMRSWFGLHKIAPGDRGGIEADPGVDAVYRELQGCAAAPRGS